VSVVIPHYNGAPRLDLTLASLAAQDYPIDLLEVVVVDDGSDIPYELPEIKPANCRVITPSTGWGRANACAHGARQTSGDVIVWLDADMIIPSDHIRSHLTWYDRLADVVTKGDILFVPTWDVTPRSVYEQVLTGEIGATLTAGGSTRQWVERIYEETDDLNTSRTDVFTTWTGATASTSREMYDRVGGMDSNLRLGEDTELAFRLWNSGAVFVPARNAIGWHLGSTNTQRRRDQVIAHDAPYFAQRIPALSSKRAVRGRTWAVPLVHAVVHADRDALVHARKCVDRILSSTETDIVVDFVGPWADMHDLRRSVLDDDDADLYTTYEWFRGDPRVRLVTQAPRSVFPATYRLDVPNRAGLRPATIAAMLRKIRESRVGALRIAFDPNGDSIDLWRVAAVERAARHLAEGESIPEAVTRLWGVRWAVSPDEFPFDDLIED
jgi:GT2 family glycosyltransferase